MMGNEGFGKAAEAASGDVGGGQVQYAREEGAGGRELDDVFDATDIDGADFIDRPVKAGVGGAVDNLSHRAAQRVEVAAEQAEAGFPNVALEGCEARGAEKGGDAFGIARQEVEAPARLDFSQAKSEFAADESGSAGDQEGGKAH